MITPSSLEAEWLGNLGRKMRRTVQELTDGMVLEVTAGPGEAFFATLELGPYQWVKREAMRRYHGPLLSFAWHQAVLEVHPDKAGLFAAALERGIPGGRRAVERWRNDLAFFQTVTDQFAENGFMSVALHVVQRVRGEIAQRPDNLVPAVQLNLWMDERYHFYQEQLAQSEIKSGAGASR